METFEKQSQDKLHKKSMREAGEILQKIKTAFPEPPKYMEQFYQMIEDEYCNDTIEAIEKNGKPVFATTCIQIPDELILAGGAIPRRICSGSHTYEQAGSDYMHARSCSLVKATAGYLAGQNLQKKFSRVIIPTTCDQKKKSARIFDDLGYNTHLLELPSRTDTEISRRFWNNSVKEFAVSFQNKMPTKITANSLKKAVQLKNGARAEYRKLHNLRKNNPPVIYGKDAMLVTNAYFFSDIEKWTANLHNLNLELEEKIARKEFAASAKIPRLLFTGAPPVFPNLKLPLLVEELGGIIVADEVCSSSRMLYNVPVISGGTLDEMVSAIADSYLKPCTCPCFSPNSNRIDKILALCDEFQVDGVIYQSFSGCSLYEMEQKAVLAALQGRNIPMLFVETDYNPEDSGQLSTRVEAFLESIQIRKKRSEVLK